MTHSQTEGCEGWDRRVINTFLSRLSVVNWHFFFKEKDIFNAPKARQDLQRNNSTAFSSSTVKSAPFAAEFWSNSRLVGMDWCQPSRILMGFQGFSPQKLLWGSGRMCQPHGRDLQHSPCSASRGCSIKHEKLGSFNPNPNWEQNPKDPIHGEGGNREKAGGNSA